MATRTACGVCMLSSGNDSFTGHCKLVRPRGGPISPTVHRQHGIATSSSIMARLTIGMPLYQNALTVRRAVDSLLGQTWGDFRLLLSDDGSTDGTADIGAAYVAADRRVHFVQQPRNLNYGNFRFVLQQAETEFFMFAAGDDWWEPEFVGACVAVLDHDPSAVQTVSQVRFHSQTGPTVLSTGTANITGSASERVARFLRAPSDNSRMYGVFRTPIAQRAFPTGEYHAFDWTFSARTLLYGDHREVGDVLMQRDRTPPERYLDMVRRDSPRLADRLLPLRAMSADLLRQRDFPKHPAVLRALLRLNLNKHVAYTRRFHPRYHRVSGAWWHRLMRML